jgi:hypothetical protein
MKSKFWKIYGVATGVGLAACVAVFVLLWTFLAAYEKSQPEHTAQKAVELFENLDVDAIMGYYGNRSKFVDSDDEIRSVIKKHIQGSDYTFSKKMSQYTSDAPAYSIKADNKEIAVVKLAKSDEHGAYNTAKWTISDIDLGFSTDGYHDIVAPADYTVTVNGTALTSDSIIESKINASDLENVTAYTSVPLLVKYRIDGSYISPDIKCTSSISGNELTPTIDGSTYTYDYELNDKLVADRADSIRNFITNYTKYMYTEADFSAISGSVIENSKAYEFLRYITYTSVWYADHSSLAIGDITLTNVKQYSSGCYSVEADYTYGVSMNGYDYSYPTKVTLYYVKSGSSWKIADLQTK